MCSSLSLPMAVQGEIEPLRKPRHESGRPGSGDERLRAIHKTRSAPARLVYSSEASKLELDRLKRQQETAMRTPSDNNDSPISPDQSPVHPRRPTRMQSLTLEIGSCSDSAHSEFLQNSWRGEILENFLFLGDRVTASDTDRLQALGVTHILNVTEDLSNFFGEMPHLSYLRVPLHDRPEAGLELESHFPECVRFIDSCAASSGRVLVHCRAGVSRSATVVIGYLMQTKKWELKTALHYVDQRRFVQPNSGFMQFLLRLERQIFGDEVTSLGTRVEMLP